MGDNKSVDSFTSAMTLSQMRISSIPERYVLPPSQRPTFDHKQHCSNWALPVVDLSSLENPLLRSRVIEQVHVAWGCSLSYTISSIFLCLDGMHVLESIKEDIEQGSQFMAVNCYPACPEPELALGLPPHSDYGLFTIILQDQQGLEIVDKNEKWQSVPFIKEALVVQVGDQMEVLTNGRYKSVVHRAILNSQKKRISIASLHSLAIDKKVIPAPELVDEEHMLSYKEVSFGDFLHFLSDNDIVEGRYIETLC